MEMVRVRSQICGIPEKVYRGYYIGNKSVPSLGVQFKLHSIAG